MIALDLCGSIVDHHVGETGASCYRGRLLLHGRFMQNYRIDGEITDTRSILIHQRNH